MSRKHAAAHRTNTYSADFEHALGALSGTCCLPEKYQACRPDHEPQGCDNIAAISEPARRRSILASVGASASRVALQVGPTVTVGFMVRSLEGTCPVLPLRCWHIGLRNAVQAHYLVLHSQNPSRTINGCHVSQW
jgi:hypothetical protein